MHSLNAGPDDHFDPKENKNIATSLETVLVYYIIFIINFRVYSSYTILVTMLKSFFLGFFHKTGISGSKGSYISLHKGCVSGFLKIDSIR